jgi:hypothetical protein
MKTLSPAAVWSVSGATAAACLLGLMPLSGDPGCESRAGAASLIFGWGTGSALFRLIGKTGALPLVVPAPGNTGVKLAGYEAA